jgi:hypothetical protein
METVTTYRELRKQLTADGQGSGTAQGWIIFNGVKMFVRKHWSYDGGYPCYADENCVDCLGELFKNYETSRDYVVNGVVIKDIHNYRDLLDFDLKFKPELSFSLSIDNKFILSVKDYQFTYAKRNNKLNELFDCLIYFAGKDCSFSGDNYYVSVKISNGNTYTVKIQPNVVFDEVKKCNYFAPGIDNQSMEKIYNFISEDIKKYK